MTSLLQLVVNCRNWRRYQPVHSILMSTNTWLRVLFVFASLRYDICALLTVRSITECLPVSDIVKSFRLRFFGHLARSAPEEDHHRVIAAALRPPTDWRRPVDRPRATWLRTIDEHVQPLNFAVHTACRKARDRDTWHQVVSTATLC